VTVSHRVGERWVGEPAPRNPPAILRFDVVDAAGRALPVPGAPNADPAGTFLVRAPGAQQVVYQGWNRNFLELPAAKFEDYLRLEGLEWALAERQKRGESAANAREVFSRSAQAWICASPMAAAASEAAPAAVGLTLELVPEQEPCFVKAGQELGVRVLFRGQPTAGLLVLALRGEKAAKPASARSDREGRVRLRLDGPGRWMIKTVHLERADQPEWEWESFWSSLTLEVVN
jgi:hypothetical protein